VDVLKYLKIRVDKEPAAKDRIHCPHEESKGARAENYLHMSSGRIIFDLGVTRYICAVETSEFQVFLWIYA